MSDKLHVKTKTLSSLTPKSSIYFKDEYE